MDGMVVFVTILVMNLLFAILCAWVATERGRDPFGWFLLGLLLGIIAFVPLAMVPSRERERTNMRHTSAVSAAQVRNRIRQERQRSGPTYKNRRPVRADPIAQGTSRRARNRERLAEIRRNRRLS